MDRKFPRIAIGYSVHGICRRCLERPLVRKYRSTTAMAFGQIVAVVGLIAILFWSMAIFRVEDGLSPEMSRTLFDLGNFTFATQWIAIGGFLLFTGISSLQTRVFAT